MAYEEIVTSSRKINGKNLNADITLTAEDVGAANKAYVDAVKRPYLVNFTKGSSSTSYTADKTLQEIYDAVQAGHQVYGYVNTNGYWAYIPLGSCFTQNSNIFVYFEGPLANGNGSMVARNKVIRYISLTGLNNDDATSKQYKFVAYNAVSSDIAINKKALNTGDITLTPSDIGSSLKVIFTLDETTGFYNSNKTLNDIYLAHSNGSVVYSEFNNEIYELTKCYKSGSNYRVAFTLIKSSGVMLQTTETKFENYGTESQDVSFKQTINYLPVLNQASIDNNTSGGYVYMSSSGTTMIQDIQDDANIGKPLFVVNFTYNSTTKNYTSDKTAKQIYDAYSANYSIIGKENNNAIAYLAYCKITTNSKYNIIFTEENLPQGPVAVAQGFPRILKLFYVLNAEASDIIFTQGVSKQVPSTRTINGKTLESNISLNAADIDAQSKITANGFLKGDGNGDITADKPVYLVNFSGSGDTRTSNKTAKQIYDAYSAGYSVIGFIGNSVIAQITKCIKLAQNDIYMIGFDGPDASRNYTQVAPEYKIWKLFASQVSGESTTFKCSQVTLVPNTRTINGYALDNDITLTAADVGAASLTGNQTISGDRTINSNISLAANNDNSNKLTVGIPTIFKNNVNFTNATVSGLMTAAVGTTTDYSIYIGSTAPAANTAPLIWIDTSTSGVMKYRTSTTSTTWTAVPVAWG